MNSLMTRLDSTQLASWVELARKRYPLRHPCWMVQGFPSWAFQVDAADLCCLCDPMMMMMMMSWVESGCYEQGLRLGAALAGVVGEDWLCSIADGCCIWLCGDSRAVSPLLVSYPSAWTSIWGNWISPSSSDVWQWLGFRSHQWEPAAIDSVKLCHLWGFRMTLIISSVVARTLYCLVRFGGRSPSDFWTKCFICSHAATILSSV